MKQVKLALIGAGNRGQGVFGQYALDMPHRAAFTAVVEPDRAKRECFADAHRIPADRCFGELDGFLAARLPELDGVVIATLEDQRLEPIFRSMERRWAILCEKPLCTTSEELIELANHTADYPSILVVCHQMRLTPVYRMIKTLIDSGRYGRIVALQHCENLAYSHMAHSFVRGRFNNSRLTPMLLAKSCHDMDLLTYIVGRNPKRVASFGSLTWFKPENCPPGAPEFCLQGCPHRHSCPYDVGKIYFNADTDPAYLRQMGVVENREQLRELLMHNQFGRCVFQCDNDVVDHQSVQVEFDDGTVSSFMMCGHNGVERRRMKISMTNGEIEYDGLRPDEIRVWSFESQYEEVIRVRLDGSHSGGDRAIMDNFVDAIASGDHSRLLTPIAHSISGHLLVFAAEASRQRGQVVELADFEAEVRAAAAGRGR